MGPIRKATSLIATMAQHALQGFPKADNVTSGGRMALCQVCDQFNNGKCNLCGCGLARKVKIPAATCPLGKW